MAAQARWSAAEYALMRRTPLPAMPELASTAPNARHADTDMPDM